MIRGGGRRNKEQKCKARETKRGRIREEKKGEGRWKMRKHERRVINKQINKSMDQLIN